MKRIITISVLVVLQSVFHLQSLAQAPPPSGSPPSSFVGAPIDDHAWVLALLLLLAGVYSLGKEQLALALHRAKE